MIDKIHTVKRSVPTLACTTCSYWTYKCAVLRFSYFIYYLLKNKPTQISLSSNSSDTSHATYTKNNLPDGPPPSYRESVQQMKLER